MRCLQFLVWYFLTTRVCVVLGAGVVAGRRYLKDLAGESNVRYTDGQDDYVVAGGEPDREEHVPYDISITDPAGQDHSSKSKVGGFTPPSSSLEKRGIFPRPLDNCPDDEVFNYSYCREEVSPQAYVIVCADGADHSWYFRRCAETEICVRGVPKPNPPLPNGQLVPPSPIAYCVRTDYFIRIGISRATHKAIPGTIWDRYKAPEGKTMAMEAVLTGQNISESIFATSFRVSAQTSDTSYNVRTWRSQVGGTAACTDCAQISIARVPAKTQRIVVDIVLDAAAEGGWLFLSQMAV
ncbi:MAG: hypothetical protein Q9209_005109 [Squamulea sp. 1 TL-2023]